MSMDDWAEASVEFTNDEDPRATVMVVRGRSEASHVAQVTMLLADEGLSIVGAAINGERDGESCDVFHVTRADGSKLPEEDWASLRGALLTVLSQTPKWQSQRPSIFGSHPGVAGEEEGDDGDGKASGRSGGAPRALNANESAASELERAAGDMAAAAAALVNIERDLIAANAKEGDTRDESAVDELSSLRSDAAATLERKMAAMEAVLASRRTAASALAARATREAQGGATAESVLGAGQDRRETATLAAAAPPSTQPAQPVAPGPEMFRPPPPVVGPATGSGYEIILQGFDWESCKNDWWTTFRGLAQEVADAGFTSVWLPPPSDAVSCQGYLPLDYYNLKSKFGSEEGVRVLIGQLHDLGVKAIADIVINHRCANHQGSDGKWNRFGGRLQWDASHICRNNPAFGGTGAWKREEDYPAAPNIDHSQERVRKDIIEWLRWLRTSVGYDGWRFDFVKGYSGRWVKEYVDATVPEIAFGEYWDTCSYSDGILDYNQDAHRQRTIDWCDATGATSAAFDFTLKGVLQEAVRRREYWRLIDSQGRPPGVAGLWPSRAVTFLENHDTGSTLQHWPFPWQNVGEGYAYLLTHPGTPCVFYDHFFYDEQIRGWILDLIRVRRDWRIGAKSIVSVLAAYGDLYAAVIDDRVAVKIGPGDWSPQAVNAGPVGAKWELLTSGFQFAVWGVKS